MNSRDVIIVAVAETVERSREYMSEGPENDRKWISRNRHFFIVPMMDRATVQ
jgi:hypothetical protein